jgi:hypothetical protein
MLEGLKTAGGVTNGGLDCSCSHHSPIQMPQAVGALHRPGFVSWVKVSAVARLAGLSGTERQTELRG